MKDAAYIADTETTGIHAPVMIECAFMRIPDLRFNRDDIKIESGRFNPGKPIELEAMATHLIIDDDLRDCPPVSSFMFPDDCGYLIGHNIDFDWEAFGKPAVKRICTLAMARRAWPTISHKLGALLLFLHGPYARGRLHNAHSASADVSFTYDVLEGILKVLDPERKITTFEALWELSEECRVPTHISFGKHKGTAIEDLPHDYKEWLLKTPDIDSLTKKAVLATMPRKSW